MRRRSLPAVGRKWAVFVFVAAALVSAVIREQAGAVAPKQLLRFIDGGQYIRVGLDVNAERLDVGIQGQYIVWISDSQQVGVLRPGDKLVAVVQRSSEAKPAQVIYRVQVQAAREQAKLQELATKLRETCPYPVEIVYVEPWYKLQVGNFSSRTEAEKAKVTLESLGFGDTWITTYMADATGESYILLEGSLGEASLRTNRIWLEPVDSYARFQMNGYQYRGGLAITLNRQLKLTAVNILPLEEYLYGVVSAEMGNVGMQEIEALKAQAVAARTYSVNHLGSYEDQGFDVFGSVQSQAYYGAMRETTAARYAVDATQGEVMVYGGEVPSSVYHSNAGGHTAFPEEVWGAYSPFLRGQLEIVQDGAVERTLGADKLGYAWEVILDQTALAQLAERLGLPGAEIHDLVVEARGQSGRVTQLRVKTSAGDIVIYRDRIRQALGGTRSLPSTKFSLDKHFSDGRLESVIIHGFGYGHGLGMSQAGAVDLAAQGWDYREILQRYYSGTQIVSLEQCRDFVALEAELESAGLWKTSWQAVRLPVDAREIGAFEFSPDGKRVAVISNSLIWLWNSEAPEVWHSYGGTDATAVEVAWLSATELAYTRVADGRTELVYLDIASGSSNVWKVGQSIRSLHYDAKQDILYAEIDGIVHACICQSETWLPLLTNAAYPALSHSSDSLAFVRDEKVWIYDTRTGQSWVLTSVSRPVRSLVWSTDDKWLVVETEKDVNVFDVGQRVAVYAVTGTNPRWMANGYLAYIRAEHSQRDIYVVRVGEWQEINLTHTDHASEWCLAWDSEKMRIAMAADSARVIDVDDAAAPDSRVSDSVMWLVQVR